MARAVLHPRGRRHPSRAPHRCAEAGARLRAARHGPTRHLHARLWARSGGSSGGSIGADKERGGPRHEARGGRARRGGHLLAPLRPAPDRGGRRAPAEARLHPTRDDQVLRGDHAAHAQLKDPARALRRRHLPEPPLRRPRARGSGPRRRRPARDVERRLHARQLLAVRALLLARDASRRGAERVGAERLPLHALRGPHPEWRELRGDVRLCAGPRGADVWRARRLRGGGGGARAEPGGGHLRQAPRAVLGARDVRRRRGPPRGDARGPLLRRGA
mmetsp:Transcript_23387/g.76131  ORF Transcript_23387/g.76131 Transcript_23387/m.76131 type:complete len:275 (+) Transcript_23387:1200-2024(+)